MDRLANTSLKLLRESRESYWQSFPFTRTKRVPFLKFFLRSFELRLERNYLFNK